MTDMEKVKKGLECLAQKREPAANPCKDCGYINRPNFAICVKDVASDALELLKEQEPRILDWDEIKDYPVVYGEFRDVKEIYPLIITINSFGECLSWNPGINISKEFILLVSDEEDRRNTRCWNKMPTEEQRLAVQWND